MKWFKPSEKLPPQGKKILYELKGDIYVVQRFADLWLPLPFHDSKHAFCKAPDLWAEFDLPEHLTGKLHVMIYGELYDIDQLEKKHPSHYKELVDAQRKMWVKKK